MLSELASPSRVAVLRSSLARRFAVAASVFLVTLVGAEVAFRLSKERLGVEDADLQGVRDLLVDGRPGNFEPRAHTVFARPRNLAVHNSLGFRGEEWEVDKRPGEIRIACLGGSTTEGGYALFLEQALEEKADLDFNVLNFGMSGWNTSETLVNWFLLAQDYRPDLVVIHHAAYDVSPRVQAGFRPDYTHFRKPWVVPKVNGLVRWLVQNSDLVAYSWIHELEAIDKLTTFPRTRYRDIDLDENGLPPMETAMPFRRNIESIGRSAEDQGADVMLLTMPARPPTEGETVYAGLLRRTIQQHNLILRDLAVEHGWLLADAEPATAELTEELRPLFIDLVHLSIPGKMEKARLVARVVLEEWLPNR